MSPTKGAAARKACHPASPPEESDASRRHARDPRRSHKLPVDHRCGARSPPSGCRVGLDPERIAQSSPAGRGPSWQTKSPIAPRQTPRNPAISRARRPDDTDTGLARPGGQFRPAGTGRVSVGTPEALFHRVAPTQAWTSAPPQSRPPKSIRRSGASLARVADVPICVATPVSFAIATPARLPDVVRQRLQYMLARAYRQHRHTRAGDRGVAHNTA